MGILMGDKRMAVEPGATPHWIGDDGFLGKFGKKYGHRRHGHIPDEIRDKKSEDAIKRGIAKILEAKIFDSNIFTEQQIDNLSNTFKAQIKKYTYEIMYQASEKIGEDFNLDNPNHEEMKSMYYYKLQEEALKIAERDYSISNFFDIEKAIELEKETLRKVKTGEITKASAKELLSELELFEDRKNISLNKINQLRERQEGDNSRGER